jgi:hypothetical protein
MADTFDQRLKTSDIHVAFEGKLQGRLPALGDEQVYSLGAHELDVGARCIEMSVIRNDVTFLARDFKQNAFCRTTLVSGDDMFVADDFVDRVAEAIEASASGVALIALHDRSPLVRGHGSGSRVSEEIDEHIICWQEEEVVVRGFQQFFALRARRPADRLDAFDSEWLDDGSYWHVMHNSTVLLPALAGQYLHVRTRAIAVPKMVKYVPSQCG